MLPRRSAFFLLHGLHQVFAEPLAEATELQQERHDSVDKAPFPSFDKYANGSHGVQAVAPGHHTRGSIVGEHQIGFTLLRKGEGLDLAGCQGTSSSQAQ